MHNAGRFFNPEDSWVQELVDETLDLIKEKELIVEVNTRGIYKKRSDSYFPDHRTLEKVQQLKIPVIISSDAHLPEELNLGFAEARQHLLEFGFINTLFFDGRHWNEIPL